MKNSYNCFAVENKNSFRKSKTYSNLKSIVINNEDK